VHLRIQYWTASQCENRTTHEYEGCVQVFVVFFRIIPVKLSGFPAVHGEEVGPRVISPERIEEFFEGGTKAGSGYQQRPVTILNRLDLTHHFGSIFTTTGFCGWGRSSWGCESIRGDRGGGRLTGSRQRQIDAPVIVGGKRGLLEETSDSIIPADCRSISDRLQPFLILFVVPK